jgi:Ca2+-binding RTX toxin-like protein
VGTLLTAQAVTSSASASCIGRARQLSGGSRVVAAKVLGAPVTADGVQTIVGNVVNGLPTGQVLTVRFNQQERTATGLTQRAVAVELKLGSTVLVSAVAGETKVSAQGDVCSATSGGGGGGAGGGSGGSGGSGGGGSGSGPGAKPCPVGSTYEQAANLCVILRTSAGGRTERIVVGKPSDGPSGGRVVALADLPRSLRGTVCAKGKGPKFAILGTNGADRITGTNRADRIMTLGGKDKAAGGRGNDCLDGGAGGGTLTGDQGKDTVVGGSGRDAIKGGADADRLVGRGGADRITSDFGKDRSTRGRATTS